MTPPVGIVIPLYRDLSTAERCLSALLGSIAGLDAKLVLINDASPEPDLWSYCREVSQQLDLHLIEHTENRGFVASVNEGISALGDRDVIILNSDTEVPSEWVQRLLAVADAHPVVSSLSSFFECSAPRCDAAD